MWADWNTWDTGETANLLGDGDYHTARRYAGTADFRPWITEWVALHNKSVDEYIRIDIEEIDWEELEEYFNE